VLLNLIVLKLEYLEPIGEGSLCRFCLREEVNSASIREGLLDVLVGEPDDLVAIGPDLTLDSIGEHHLLLAVGVYTLDLAILASSFLD